MKAALNASNDAIGSGSVASEHLQVLQESEIRVSAVGGSDEGVANLIRSGQLRDYFDPETELSLTQARPLSYTVRNLADNSIAVVSETTEYNLRECATADATPTGASYKLTLDRLSLIADGCDGAFSPSPEVYYSFSLHTDAGTRTIISTPASAARCPSRRAAAIPCRSTRTWWTCTPGGVACASRAARRTKTATASTSGSGAGI